MDVVTGWTGRTACALQAALRMSNEAFAEHLGIGVRTVAAWHQKPGLRPRPEMQQVLDPRSRGHLPAAVERFAMLTGEPARAVSARQDDDGAAARLSTGSLPIRTSAGPQPPGPARGLGTRNGPPDRSRRGSPAWTGGTCSTGRAAEGASARRDVADALGKYYRCQAGEHGRYGARCGPDGPRS